MERAWLDDIAAKIARAHGGTLRVASSAAAGTDFVFRLPRTPLIQQ